MTWKVATALMLIATTLPIAAADHPDCVRDGIVGETYCDMPHPTPFDVIDSALEILCGDPAGEGCVEEVERLIPVTGGDLGGCWTNFRMPWCY